jgi:putative CocE/NonD family hydrolase
MFHDRISVERKVKIPMRDGVNLIADIYRPKNVDAPLPILLMRLPYGRAIASTVVYKHPSWYAEKGYIVVIQEVRGTGNSEGEFYPFRYEYNDGFDTVQWCINEILHNNGKLGMYGFSYQGVTQFQSAVMQPQGLVTICPCMASADLYNGFLYWGNALCWEFVLTWAVQLTQIRAQNKKLEPQATNLLQMQSEIKNWLTFLPMEQMPFLRDESLADFFGDWLTNHHGTEAYWQELNPLTYFDKYDLPALHIGGWADIFIEGTVNTYWQARAHTNQPQHLVIPPYQHFPWSSRVGDIDFGMTVNKDIDRLQIDWFDFWLKGIDNGIIQQQPVNLFLMGSNEWLKLTEFPSGQDLTLYLGSDFILLSEPNHDAHLPHTIVYDPRVPTPTTNYSFCDQFSINQRWDILVYTSDSITNTIKVVGSPKVVLQGEVSNTPTDWVVKLLDIHPDGRQLLVTMGILHYASIPDLIQEITIQLRPTAHSFLAQHKIGLAIAGGAFPMISRADITATAIQLVENTLQIYPQGKLLLPII